MKFSDPKRSKSNSKVAVSKAVNQSSHPSKTVSKGIKAPESVLKRAAMIDPGVAENAASASEEPVRRSIFKSTFNTHDIMHAPVEKTIQMLDKILAGERLFTM